MSRPASRMKAPHRRRWEFLLLLLPLLGMLCLGGLLLIQGLTDAQGPRFIPVNLHSVLQADYGANPNFSPIQSIGLDIIWDTILDHEPDATDLKDRQEALLNSLQTPIPFVTPVTCQGVHLLYTDQDTWTDSATPTGRHGYDSDLQLGRDGDRSTRLLLHFMPTDTIRPGTFIKSARLEMFLAATASSITPRIRLFNGAAPFEESSTDWSNQPEPLLQYRADTLAVAGGHAWDATDLVRDWLLGRQPNNGLIIELPPPANALYLYHSKEADSQAHTKTNSLPQPLDPRLVIDCGATPSQPETLAAITSTPLPTGSPQPFPAATPTPATTPLLPPSPTQSPRTPTTPPGTPTPVVLPDTSTPIAPPVTPTPIVPPASPTSIVPSTTPVEVAPSATPIATRAPVGPTPTSRPPTSQPPATSAPPPTATATSTATPTPTSTPVLPSLSINDVTVTEGDAGTVNAVFTASLSVTSAQTVTVNYATANNTAATPADYTAAGGTLAIAPGLATQTITVAVQGDTLDEPDETFLVNLSGAANAAIGDGQGVGTIVDDDITIGGCSSPVITLTATADTYLNGELGPPLNTNYGLDPTLLVHTEGTTQTQHSLIQFNLSAIPSNSIVSCATLLLNQTGIDSNHNIQVHRITASWVEGNGINTGATWNNRDRGALLPWTTQGGDYNSAVEAGFVADTAGQRVINLTSLTQFWVNDPASNFGLLLGSQQITPGPEFTAQFDSRETANPPRLVVQYLPTLSINDVTVLEGDSGVTNAIFTVTMSAASGQIVSVDYATADNTATTANNDYLAAGGTLIFPPGITTRPITVTVIGDTNVEGDESFLIYLSSPANAAIADGQGIGTIQQDLTGFDSPLLPDKPKTIYLPLILK